MTTTEAQRAAVSAEKAAKLTDEELALSLACRYPRPTGAAQRRWTEAIEAEAARRGMS